MRLHVELTGQVQGVGFRPFVWRQAAALGLTGWVTNDAHGVCLEVQGPAPAVQQLLDRVRVGPPLARVDQVRHRQAQLTGATGFDVRPSPTSSAGTALVAPDLAPCASCLAEMTDPDDRRAGHPFVCCTDCGPRYSIIESLPYDRERTAMAGFAMCPTCRHEYDDPADRRFHAEPTCCPRCGPRLRLLDPSGGQLPGDPVDGAVALLAAGGVVAVKSVGGYHLAVDAGSEAALQRLRTAKRRPDKPFALLVADLAAARMVGRVSEDEAAALSSPARPVVLLHRLPSAPVAPAVAPGSALLGVMLPSAPLHQLLMIAHGRPLVLTSGNAGSEPPATDERDALARLGPLVDGLLVHDRRILTRVDDSVVRVVGGQVVPIRRSRGYVPTPIRLTGDGPVVLAVGGAMKNTVCVTRGAEAFVSEHLGDLDDFATATAYRAAVTRLTELLGVRPAVVAHDLHPGYPSTRYAQSLPGARLVPVQHHHAHIASCLVDNGRPGPVIGVAFDGLGLGTDGTIWGGEVLVADLVSSRRAGHLSPAAQPGGDAATRHPWRMAAAHLHAAYDGAIPSTAVAGRHREWDQVLSVVRQRDHAPHSTSAGRLFDAVAALVGLGDSVTYEGQAAIALEQVADPLESGSYPMPVTGQLPVQLSAAHLVRAVVTDLATGETAGRISRRFHAGLAIGVAEACRQVREREGLTTVALSGGVFQNVLLTELVRVELDALGFEVLTHLQVPCNDGGLSLGQAAVARARWAQERPAQQ